MTAFDADAVIAQVDRAATLGAETTGSMRRIAEGYCRQVNEELDDVLALLGPARGDAGSARRWEAATAASTHVLSSAPPTTSVNQWAACKQQAHAHHEISSRATAAHAHHRLVPMTRRQQPRAASTIAT